MVAAEQMALFARARPRRRLCPACGYVHAGMDARAVGRFESGGPAGYRAAYDGAPLRATRSAAVQDMCAARRRRQAAEAATPEGTDAA